MALNALDRHIALIGFMGAGKTTIAPQIAQLLDRKAVEVDEVVADKVGDIGEVFKLKGEAFFRVQEARHALLALGGRSPRVLGFGGGAVTSPSVREALAESAYTVLLDIDVQTAWERVGGQRPLAQDEQQFRSLYSERRPLYREVADAVVESGDVDGVLLAAAGVHYELGALGRLGELVPGDGPVALVADSAVLGIHGPAARVALGDRLQSVHELPAGEAAKQLAVVERLWSELRLDRGGTIVALGGGTATDTAGFAAATYLRGVPWVAVPTSLVGQVDAGIGGKTAIDTAQGKNLVGAFHWPARVVIDETLLETLPERERRQGEAERIKTELLAARDLDVRAAAAYKAALCVRDPYDRGPRQWLNLGHTFAHALEAAADFDLPHGEAVALGLVAALRLSGRDTGPVEAALDPRPVEVDRERAWAALGRDKKRTGEAINLVLLGDKDRWSRPGPLTRYEQLSIASFVSDRAVSQIIVLNGVNLDVIGRRDPSLYGGLSMNELESQIYEWAHALDITARCRQTNSEGEFIEWIHDSYDNVDGLILNPGAWSHYSYAIRDALELLEVPVVEVHLSNIEEREEWRRHSVIADVVSHRVIGKGPDGYREALEFLAGKEGE